MDQDQDKVAGILRAVTLLVIEGAFVAMMTAFVAETFQAKDGVVPDLSDVQTQALGGLALVLGGGYAVLLGLPSPPAGTPLSAEVKRVAAERPLLFLGAALYMLAGFAACLAYGLNEDETPSVLKTIAVAFGGYVIAYIGGAYRQLTTDTR